MAAAWDQPHGAAGGTTHEERHSEAAKLPSLLELSLRRGGPCAMFGPRLPHTTFQMVLKQSPIFKVRILT